jgi:hypothetical protein
MLLGQRPTCLVPACAFEDTALPLSHTCCDLAASMLLGRRPMCLVAVCTFVLCAYVDTALPLSHTCCDLARACLQVPAVTLRVSAARLVITGVHTALPAPLHQAHWLAAVGKPPGHATSLCATGGPPPLCLGRLSRAAGGRVTCVGGSICQLCLPSSSHAALPDVWGFWVGWFDCVAAVRPPPNPNKHMPCRLAVHRNASPALPPHNAQYPSTAYGTSDPVLHSWWWWSKLCSAPLW